MRKDEEKQKQMQASEHSSVFSSFAGNAPEETV